MALQAAPQSFDEPAFGLPDRLAKSRAWCGIKSASDMAQRLTDYFGNRLRKPIKGSTVSAWEAGTNQPTTIRLDELVTAWVDICNEAGEPLGRRVSAEFIYGLKSGSFSSLLRALDVPTGQGALLDTEGEPYDFFSRPELVSV